MTFARCPQQAQVAVLGEQVFSGSNEAHGTMMVVWGGGGVEGWGVEKWGGVGVLAAAFLPPGFPHCALGSYLYSHQSLRLAVLASR